MANQSFLKKIESGNIHLNKNVEKGTYIEEVNISGPKESADTEQAESGPEKDSPVPFAMSQTEQKIIQFTCTKAMEGLFENFRSEIYTEAFVKRLANQYKEGLLSYNNPHLVTLIHECVEKELRIDFLGDMTAEVLLYIIHEQG